MTRFKPFPDTLFVKRENDGTDEEYLTADEEIETLAEIGETPMIAEYKLVRADKVRVQVNWPAKSK